MKAQNEPQDDQNDQAHNADRGILPVEVGACAFLYGRGNFLHAGRSGIRGQHLPAGHKTIDQRRPPAEYDQHFRHYHHQGFPLHIVSLMRHAIGIALTAAYARCV